MARPGFCGLIFLMATFGLCGLAIGQRGRPQEKTRPYDGRWWLSVASLEQRGYISGTFDCDRWELGDKSAPRSTVGKVQKFVSQFYEDPPHWRTSVFRVIKMSDLHHTDPSKGAREQEGEVWSEPHGYWDGLWWKGAGYPNTLEQVGYVEGYLTCYRTEAHDSKGAFSKSPPEYVSLITNWYRQTRREDAKIADVLFKFCDQEKPPKGGRK